MEQEVELVGCARRARVQARDAGGRLDAGVDEAVDVAHFGLRERQPAARVVEPVDRQP